MSQLAIEPMGDTMSPEPTDVTTFRADVFAGLSAPAKTLPSKYFYDARGSELFEAICDTPEYYVTRSETALLRRIAPGLAETIPLGATLVEFGSGASLKTRILLAAAPQIVGYVPIDISSSALAAAARTIREDFPDLHVTPVVADFTKPTSLPGALRWASLVGFFPGSTLGNFAPEAAVLLLRSMRLQLGANSRLIVGVDVVKDKSVLIPAYDDAAGVTAAFNLNLLDRINQELNGDFDTAAFTHEARWSAQDRRVEMHLISRRNQSVRIADWRFDFASGETIHTENSYKYSQARLQALAHQSGWRLAEWRVSEAPEVAVAVLQPNLDDFDER